MGKHITIYLSDEYLTKLDLIKTKLGVDEYQDAIRVLIDKYFNLVKHGAELRDVTIILDDLIRALKKVSSIDINELSEEEAVGVLFQLLLEFVNIAKKHRERIMKLLAALKEIENETTKIICPHCGAVIAEVIGDVLSTCSLVIEGDGVYCGYCGKKLSDDVARQLGVVTDGNVTIFGLGYRIVKHGD